MTSFSLIHQSWIPVTDLRGEPESVGLGDLFSRAAQLRAVVDASPLTTVAIYRVLLAILFRTHPVRVNRLWNELLRDGWNHDVIVDYLQQQEDRLDLFSEAEPAFQRADLNADELEATPLTKLTHELVSKNNKQMFDHSHDEKPRAFSAAEAARILITAQAWSLGGGVSGGKRPNFTSGPLVGGIATLIEGQNLQQTLLLNMFPLPAMQHKPQGLPNIQDPGRPVWERDRNQRHEKRSPTGIADVLTWESRYVRLLPNEDGTVSHAIFVQGEQISPPTPFIDPMHAYRVPKTGTSQPVPFRPDRAAWRDGTALLTSLAVEGIEGPAIAVAAAGEERLFSKDDRVSLCFAALANKKADPVLWTWQRFRVPGELIDSASAGNAKAQLERTLRLSDKVEKALRSSLADLGRSIAFERFQNAGVLGNMDREQRERANTFVERLCRTDHYWSRLEFHFQEFLDDFGNDALWRREVRDAALDTFSRSTSSLELTPRHARALARARARFYRTLNHYIPREEQDEVA